MRVVLILALINFLAVFIPSLLIWIKVIDPIVAIGDFVSEAQQGIAGVFTSVLVAVVITIIGIWKIPSKIYNRQQAKLAKTRRELKSINDRLPELRVTDGGVETKLWKGEYSESFFVKVTSLKHEAKDVLATVQWFDLDRPKLRFAPNNGRWWYPQKDIDSLTSSALQTVNIRGNGEEKVIHFARMSKDDSLCMWFREQDDRTFMQVLRSSGRYRVDILFKSSNYSETECSMYISVSPGVIDWGLDDFEIQRIVNI